MTRPTHPTHPTRLAPAVLLALLVAGCLPAGTRGTATHDASAAGATPAADAAPSAAGGPGASPTFVAPTPTPAPTFAVYTVAKGDSLNSIARKYATTARSIAFWNRTAHPSLDPESTSYAPGKLQVGWTLQLIPGLVYDEETGDPVLPSGAIPAP